MARLEIKKGDVFSDYTVVKELEPYRLPSGQINRCFLVKCVCGNEKPVRLLHLVRGRAKNCGCAYAIRNGEGNTKLCKLWRAINRRCSAFAHYTQRKDYFEKGIRVCDEWRDSWDSFKNWALANGYKEGLQIDRIDSTGNYTPENCRFVTPKENCNNRGVTFKVVYKGVEYAFTDLIEQKNLSNHAPAIRGRIKRGWSIDDAFDKPIREGNYVKAL